MKSKFFVCVFCGANIGKSTLYANEARLLAKAFVEANIGLVYGGGSVGIMGILADEVMKLGGEVQGVIPKFMNTREIRNDKITQVYEVESMHQRKMKMFELCDAFVTFPGGFGTLDETFEILTWKQIGLHKKPLILFNVEGYFDPLIDFVNSGVDKGFIRPSNLDLFKTVSSISEVMQELKEEKQ